MCLFYLIHINCLGGVVDIMGENIYIKNSLLNFKRIDNELFLWNEDDNSVFLLNETAYTIWKLCDGVRSVNTIITELSNLYGVQPSKMKLTVNKIIDEFNNLGLIY